MKVRFFGYQPKSAGWQPALPGTVNSGKNAERSTFSEATNPPSQRCGAAGYLQTALAVETTLSKRLSPRKSSQRELKRGSPHVSMPISHC
jgi:hypothetical protein